MTLRERIKILCKKNGISLNKLETECGFAKGYLSKLDKSTPNMVYLQRVANFFGVTTDFLLTGKENVEDIAILDVKLTELDSRIKEYALKLSKLSPEKQELVMKLIDSLE